MTAPIDDTELLPDADRALVDALREDYLEACREAPVPSAGLVWWRANLRARADAAEKVDWPFTVAHGVIGATIAGAACGVGALVWQSVPALPPPSLGLLVSLAVGVCVIVAPLALVLTFSRDSK